jgi:hypothetical protein
MELLAHALRALQVDLTLKIRRKKFAGDLKMLECETLKPMP